jgi:hypothetical protein
MAALLPVEPDFRENRRDDGRTDFAPLKARGLVRDKGGNKVPIDRPVHTWSALDRDRLYQGYCGLVTAGASERAARDWIAARAAELNMSEARAIAIIN